MYYVLQHGHENHRHPRVHIVWSHDASRSTIMVRRTATRSGPNVARAVTLGCRLKPSRATLDAATRPQYCMGVRVRSTTPRAHNVVTYPNSRRLRCADFKIPPHAYGIETRKTPGHPLPGASYRSAPRCPTPQPRHCRHQARANSSMAHHTVAHKHRLGAVPHIFRSSVGTSTPTRDRLDQPRRRAQRLVRATRSFALLVLPLLRERLLRP